MEWYIKVWKQFADFSGRARRKEYWMFALVNLLIAVVLAFIESLLGLTAVLGTLYALAVLIPSLAVSVRRLHDTSRSGWWVLISLVPVIGTLILLIFLVLEGDAASNEYGPDPKATAA